jgi:ribose transport system substrate-binding protein
MLYKTPMPDSSAPKRRRTSQDVYLVKSVMHASEVLGAFQHMGDALRLRDVVERTGFGKGMAFRLLHTLHHCGFLEKSADSRYRLTSEVRRRRRYGLGYAAQGQDTSFPR